MTKIITVSEAQIEEIILRPIDNIVTVSYRLLDENGDMINTKRVNIPPGEATKEVTDIVSKLLANVSNKEDL